jgi:hypothetical protein
MDILDKKVISLLAIVAVTVAGGTFAITKYINEQQVKVLEERLKLSDTINGHDSIARSKGMISIPSSVLEDGARTSGDKDLLDKLKRLESEKRSLLSKLSKMAEGSLDPSSEVGSLLIQLEEGKREIATIDTLLRLKDPITFEALQNYFSTNKSSSGIIGGKLTSDWYDFFVSTSEKSGLEFVAYQLNERDSDVRSTFRFLTRSINSAERCNIVTPALEQIALTNSNPDIRAKSKILLQCGIDKNGDIPDSRYSDDRVGTNHNAFIVFSKNNLMNDFFRLAENSGNITYWGSSTFLFRGFIESDYKNRNYLNALVELSDMDMSASSKAFSKFLLSRLHKVTGESILYEEDISLCKKAAPTVCTKLLQDEKNIRTPTKKG